MVVQTSFDKPDITFHLNALHDRQIHIVRRNCMRKLAASLLLLSTVFTCAAQGPQGDRQQFIRVEAPVVILRHVRVVDGTGAAALEDQTITIAEGKIKAIQTGNDMIIPNNAKVLDLPGYTVLPGLVGMHDHMFFPMGGTPPMYSNMGFSFPRLYLALGVTTIRTTGSVAPYADLEIKKLIDAGRMIGPKMHITAPYLEGVGSFTPVMHQLKDADDARKMVNYWADQGATSFKAYMNITRDELRAVVEEAHKRGLKVTGHLCSVGYREAAEIGIDNLEHGIFANSEFVANKESDKCPGGAVSQALRTLDVKGDAVQQTIKTLVAKNVAVTSTLPVFEAGAPLASAQAGPTAIGAPSAVMNQRMLNSMNNDARVRYLTARSRITADSLQASLVRKSMDFERAFVAAGGLLLAGLDPTGNGGVVAGFGDLREVELLVEAGFTPLEAIKIASFNGARFLGEDSRIGSIAIGKQADLMIVKGNPAIRISDIENVEIVFKDGVGYDSEKLIQSVQGLVGIR
jgi:imidazolonepropionase-like amidohydrolase